LTEEKIEQKTKKRRLSRLTGRQLYLVAIKQAAKLGKDSAVEEAAPTFERAIYAGSDARRDVESLPGVWI